MSDSGPTPPPLPPVPPSLPPSQVPPVISSVPRKKMAMPLWAKIMLVVVFLGCAFVGYRVVQFALYVKDHPRSSTPGIAEFNEANHQILAYHGTAAFGNTPAAVELAKEFSTELKLMRTTFFTAGKKDAFSVAKGEFLTYCQWNGDSCVFLVHVPELRRFTADAKKSIAELAWSSAQSALKDGKQPPPKTVVVGVRGAILYDEILIGDFVAEPKSQADGIQTRAEGFGGMTSLYPYFAEQSAPVPTPAATNAPQ